MSGTLFWKMSLTNTVTMKRVEEVVWSNDLISDVGWDIELMWHSVEVKDITKESS